MNDKSRKFFQKHITKEKIWNTIKRHIYFIPALAVTFPLFWKNTEGQWKFLAEMLLLYLVLNGFYYLEALDIKNEICKKLLAGRKLISGILVVFICSLNLYCMIDLKLDVLKTETDSAYFYNMILYLSVYLLIYIVTNSARITTFLGTGFWTVVMLVNYFLVIFRGKPLYANDLLVIKTAYNVSSSYHYVLNEKTTWYLMYAIATIFCGLGMIRAFQLETTKVHWKRRVAGALVLAGFYTCFYQTDFIYQDGKVKAQYWSHEKNGFLLNFLMQTKDLFVEAPDGYDVKNIEAVAWEQKEKQEESRQVLQEEVSQEKTSKEKVSQEKASQKNPVKEKPNVIAIMNESFSDFTIYDNLETNKEITPFINQLSENTIKGTAHVSIFGGTTANSEFEFLTGDSMYMYQGTSPYQIYIQNPVETLVSTMKEQGYTTIGMHPYKGNGYSRQSVYKHFGFDKIAFMEDFAHQEVLRGFIGDSCLYDKIIEEYEQKGKEEKIFSFNVTMQNHGGYETKYDNFPEEIYLTDCKGQYPKAEQALSLMHESDKAIEKLITYFEKEKEPTIIVFFGDHQPNISDAFYEKLFGKPLDRLTQEEKEKMYQVPYFIWANYDIEEEEGKELSLNYLSSILLKTAGLKMSGYQSYLLDLYEEYPVINALEIVDKNQNVHWVEENTASGPDAAFEPLNLYQQMMYNHLLDKKHTVNEFFSVEQEME